MDPFVESVLEEILIKNNDVFGDQIKFMGFESSTSAPAGATGFQSNSIRGSIRYINKTGNLLMSPPLLLKCTPKEKFAAYKARLIQFTNEIFVYGHVLPFFSQLEASTQTSGLNEHLFSNTKTCRPQIQTMFPKFYGSSTRTHSQSTEVIIALEDLSHSNYKTAPQKSFLNFAHLSLMARSLGKFHAYSYFAKESNLKLFNAHAQPLTPINPMLLDEFPGLLTKIGSRGLIHLISQNEFLSSRPVIQNLLDNADQLCVRLLRNEHRNKWAVICHGDYLSTNVLFKYAGDQPIDMKIIDLAMATLSSPVIDLSFLLYINADQETRDLYWDKLIDEYCNGLSSLSVEVKSLPTRDDIIKEFHTKAFYAYLVAAIFLAFLLVEDMGQHIPSEYLDYELSEIPEDILVDMIMNLAGETGTKALGDILKDMLKRGFLNTSDENEQL